MYAIPGLHTPEALIIWAAASIKKKLRFVHNISKCVDKSTSVSKNVTSSLKPANAFETLRAPRHFPQRTSKRTFKPYINRETQGKARSVQGKTKTKQFFTK